VKVTWVPLCGGVPAASRICARITVVPLAESAVVDAVSVIVEPVGARSGTFWHPTVAKDSAASADKRSNAR
jgi:hypothetical protein